MKSKANLEPSGSKNSYYSGERDKYTSPTFYSDGNVGRLRSPRPTEKILDNMRGLLVVAEGRPMSEDS